jgi:hypothetical protein
MEEAYDELKNMKIDLSTLKVANNKLTEMRSKFDDLRENWSCELVKIRDYFDTTPNPDEVNEEEILKNASRLVAILQSMKRLSEIENIRKSKEEEVRSELIELKKMLDTLKI